MAITSCLLLREARKTLMTHPSTCFTKSRRQLDRQLENAGRVFKDSDKFDANDEILKEQTQEWSGSATFTSDGKIRLFYTDFSGKHYSKQSLTTAQVNVSKSDDTLKINGVEDHKTIFDGDGKHIKTFSSLSMKGTIHPATTIR